LFRVGTSQYLQRLVAVHRLIYISRSLVGTDPGAIDAIVDRSATRNQSQGITGVLWSDGVSFAQVLEGEHHAVVETMNRIRADLRHSEIEVVLDRAIAQRMFGRWAMVLSDTRAESTAETAFLLGFAAGQHTPSARKLHEIVMSAFERDC
jgi:hypothetical protein